MVYPSDKRRMEFSLQRFREALYKGVERGEVPGYPSYVSKEDEELLNRPIISEERLAEKLYNEEASLDVLADNKDIVLADAPPVFDEAAILEDSKKKNRALRASRRSAKEKKIIQHKASSEIYQQESRKAKDTYVTPGFNRKAINPDNNANPDIRDVNATQMLMENIYDWDSHEEQGSLPFTRAELRRIARSLDLNITQSCPAMQDRSVLNLFETLAENNWLGDFHYTRSKARLVVRGYLEAQNGSTILLDKARDVLQDSLNRIVIGTAMNWKHHEAHNGESVTGTELIAMAANLRNTIAAVYPMVKDSDALDFFVFHAEQSWLGDLPNIKTKTVEIVEAYTHAYNGNTKPLDDLKEKFRKSTAFLERQYSNLEPPHIDLKKLAEAMDRSGKTPKPL